VGATVVTVLIDLPPDQPYRGATLAALDHAAGRLETTIEARVLRTDAIDARLIADPGSAVVVGPGSPYRDPEAVHAVVRSARERSIPLVGT
jgi:CTP synthase (UTP-ammonia lyase)